MRLLFIAGGVAVSLLIARTALAARDLTVTDFSHTFAVELPDGTLESVEVTGTWRITEYERYDAAGGVHYYLRSEIRAAGIGELTGIRYRFVDGTTAQYNLKKGVEGTFTELKRMVSQGQDANIWESSQLAHVTMTPNGDTVVDFNHER